MRSEHEEAISKSRQLLHRLNKEKSEREIRRQQILSKHHQEELFLQQVKERQMKVEEERKLFEQEQKRIFIKERMAKRKEVNHLFSF